MIFELTTGVRQSGRLKSPPLFNLFTDYVMRIYEHGSAQENIQFIRLKYRIRPTACTQAKRMSGYHVFSMLRKLVRNGCKREEFRYN